ncbi:hypothetical protein SNOG_01108 [Parastagonospora nodorum SN15]|uniref:Malonyl-CoA:ACP transacylase (MAT) domain-containing protein n=1 Tax=Phaeosphaeria nodorum (strain SN15 / ATCC MYA-4574 / FGSC 10173) TaxID=321614 RepID=Q0V4F6_PHANO|nr:hypothetical protein SNOG_01108 [Parastagonospora nodorum SN15]EAT92603.2 hypothetical protein SNOG_01108 [Parastagonospora nodorum SN15]
MILCEVDDLPLSTRFQAATHVVDFGPGGMSGVGSLLLRNKEGTGLRVILAGLAESSIPELGDIAELLSDMPIFGANWAAKYSPQLVRTKEGFQIRNKMTRLLGLPPCMVGGMTPTTASWDFVGAIISAGYHAEVAAGGLHTAEDFNNTIKSLAILVRYGEQLPLIRKLRSEGFPIDGITFGAGVPSTESLREYLDIGLRYLAFKPGSATAIDQVIAIARANPDVPIVLQWTSGRGGGHHSYEDFHDLIIKTYAKIRRCDNIVLLAGSGFGGAADTYPYLSGNWSSRFGLQPMPFDGVLFGSRMMVAKEAHTSQGAKEAIVAAPGINEEASWEQSYRNPVGGIITVNSEMGEPIHKLATRGVLLWRELDDKVFSISDRAQRIQKLMEMKPYIIERLNKDFQKVWFGLDSQGIAVDLEDMTYAEIIGRLIQLCYIKTESRWIDKGYKQLTADFIRQTYSRLQCSASAEIDMEQPLQGLQEVMVCCKIAEKEVVTYSDARYFILLCKRQGQKPPPFIPALDEDFETWFKKDSLWQSEDLAAVVDEDAGRICILQGPVAARYSKKINEPVAEILGDICQQHISQILRDAYNSDETLIPSDGTVLRLGKPAQHTDVPSCCRVSRQGSETIYYIDETASQERLPHMDGWTRALLGAERSWLSALVMSEDIMRDKIVIPNPIRRALAPLPGMQVVVAHATVPSALSLVVYENASNGLPSLEIRKKGDLIFVTVFVHDSVVGNILSLSFRFAHRPDTPLHPICEISEGRNKMLRNFYDRLWFGSEVCRAEPDTSELNLSKLVVESHPTKISLSSVQAFMDSIESPEGRGIFKDVVPLDHCIVVAWEAMMRATFAGAIGCDFLSLVHLSNRFTLLSEKPLGICDKVTSTAEIRAVRNLLSGRSVEVVATITRDGLPAVEITSEFLFRGTYTDFSVCFEKRKEPKMVLTIDHVADISVLQSKKWVSLEPDFDPFWMYRFTHIAMKDGLRVLSFQAIDSENRQVVVEGEAEVDQLLTAYVFTGQGSQKEDMGMDLYATSEVARQVWDEADRFYSDTYGFCISDIVKRNPKQLTIFFGGRKGKKLRENYMTMMVESIDGQPERFFKSIKPTTTSYTFQHNAGLLFSTEFAQPALTVMERAQFLHLKDQGLVTTTALFAGHSLGEYTSLSTIGNIMSFQNLLSVVFYRGLTMRSAVKRDGQGRSKFAMVAVNPSRANTTAAVLLKVVTTIVSALPEDLLEIVNYNVETQQYVAAGTLSALSCLGDVMDYVSKNRKLCPEEMATFIASRTAFIMDQMPTLTRGVATIPLEGIDVPFHSSFLLPKMSAFRRVLQQYIEPGAINSERLVGKYISNVTGKPFDITHEGISSLHELTGSIVLEKLLAEMKP